MESHRPLMHVCTTAEPIRHRLALVVTGGGQGIGAEISRLAARAGWPVVLLHRSQPAAALRVVSEIEAAGGRATAVSADVGVESDVVRAFTFANQRYGGVQGLVNNAVDAGEPMLVADLDAVRVQSLLQTNVLGPLLCSREAVNRMARSRGGRGGAVVNMSSVVAIQTGGSPGGYVAFAACKGAIETMSLGIAKEAAGEGIRSNVVRCGVIDTETRRTQSEDRIAGLLQRVPERRMGRPLEVARAVLWLLSEEASYVTGATVEVAGGL